MHVSNVCKTQQFWHCRDPLCLFLVLQSMGSAASPYRFNIWVLIKISEINISAKCLRLHRRKPDLGPAQYRNRGLLFCWTNWGWRLWLRFGGPISGRGVSWPPTRGKRIFKFICFQKNENRAKILFFWTNEKTTVFWFLLI